MCQKYKKEDILYSYNAPSHRYMYDLNISLYEYSGMTQLFFVQYYKDYLQLTVIYHIQGLIGETPKLHSTTLR